MAVEAIQDWDVHFRENVKYNSMLAKKRTKPKHRLPWRLHEVAEGQRGLSGTEIVQVLLENYGIRITSRTLLNYGKCGDIDPPTTRAAGRGKGLVSLYPLDTIEKAAAAWKRRHPNA